MRVCISSVFSNTSMLNTDIGEDIDGRDILIYDVFQFASDIWIFEHRNKEKCCKIFVHSVDFELSIHLSVSLYKHESNEIS